MEERIDKLIKVTTEHSLVLFNVHQRFTQFRDNPSKSLLSVTLDILLGLVITSQLTQMMMLEKVSLSQTVFISMETVIRYLKTLIVWLMENPAGLKLNSILSQALGNFFLYHIHLWMTYVMLVVPLITPYLTNIISLLQCSGLSLQLSCLSDLFLMLTIHIHCFYAYARRLAVSQSKGLVALWRLFLGKKYNPLRDRVDSADSTVEQLFLGTIIFTILLFLMPTTATFFAVFFVLKWFAHSIKLLLRRTVSLIQFIPNKI